MAASSHDECIRVQVLSDEQDDSTIWGARNVFRFHHEDGNGGDHFSAEYECQNMDRMYYHAEETRQEWVTREDVNKYKRLVRKELAAKVAAL